MPFSESQSKWYDVNLQNQVEVPVCYVVDMETLLATLMLCHPKHVVPLWHDRHVDHDGEHAHVG